MSSNFVRFQEILNAAFTREGRQARIKFFQISRWRMKMGVSIRENVQFEHHIDFPESPKCTFSVQVRLCFWIKMQSLKDDFRLSTIKCDFLRKKSA